MDLNTRGFTVSSSVQDEAGCVSEGCVAVLNSDRVSVQSFGCWGALGRRHPLVENCLSFFLCLSICLSVFVFLSIRSQLNTLIYLQQWDLCHMTTVFQFRNHHKNRPQTNQVKKLQCRQLAVKVMLILNCAHQVIHISDTLGMKGSGQRFWSVLVHNDTRTFSLQYPLTMRDTWRKPKRTW